MNVALLRVWYAAAAATSVSREHLELSDIAVRRGSTQRAGETMSSGSYSDEDTRNQANTLAQYISSGSSADTSSSSEEASQGNDAPPTQSTSHHNTIEYDEVPMDASLCNLTAADLAGQDVELWLVRIPKHPTLLEKIVGKTVSVCDNALASLEGDEKCGSLRGSYLFRDHGVAGTRGVRAAFVVSDSGGDASLRISKPFRRSLSVTFDAKIKDIRYTEQEDKQYPQRPQGLKLQYNAIGSKRKALERPAESLPVECLAQDEVVNVDMPQRTEDTAESLLTLREKSTKSLTKNKKKKKKHSV